MEIQDSPLKVGWMASQVYPEWCLGWSNRSRFKACDSEDEALIQIWTWLANDYGITPGTAEKLVWEVAANGKVRHDDYCLGLEQFVSCGR